MYRELSIHSTGFEGLLQYPVIFTGSLQGRITSQGDPCSHYRDWVCSEHIKKNAESENGVNLGYLVVLKGRKIG